MNIHITESMNHLLAPTEIKSLKKWSEASTEYLFKNIGLHGPYVDSLIKKELKERSEEWKDINEMIGEYDDK